MAIKSNFDTVSTEVLYNNIIEIDLTTKLVILLKGVLKNL
jgi:hypothetical protein